MDSPFDLFIMTDEEECQRTVMSWVFVGYERGSLNMYIHLIGLHIFKAVPTRLEFESMSTPLRFAVRCLL